MVDTALQKADFLIVEQATSAEVLRPLDALKSSALLASPLREKRAGTILPRYILVGARGGGDPVKIGIFAGIHGDEPACPQAVVETVRRLVDNVSLTTGYQLFFYPICNPGGFDRNSRLSVSGKDLNREFWKNSSEPEVRLLEKEIESQNFAGLISLHSDDTSGGMYGFVRGAVLTSSLLEPALAAAERVLPRNLNSIIDGFPASNGIISKCYDGILTSPPKLEQLPFEVILETPQHARLELQVEAFCRAIFAILSEYQKFIAFAANL
jgi:protein MpaA